MVSFLSPYTSRFTDWRYYCTILQEGKKKKSLFADLYTNIKKEYQAFSYPAEEAHPTLTWVSEEITALLKNWKRGHSYCRINSEFELNCKPLSFSPPPRLA